MSNSAQDALAVVQDAGRPDETDAPDGAAAASELLVSQVASKLRDLIIQDELKPGARIRERQLSERLNVSRTPLREAIRILVSERLVDSLPNRGAVVAKPNREDVRQLLEVLGGLEALAGELAAAAATDAEVQEILALHHEMLSAYYRRDKLTYFKINQAIHKGIVAASGNQVLVETHRQINARLYRIRYVSNERNDRWREAIDEHERIAEALADRDGARLAQVMRHHIGQTWVKVGIASDWS
jgi:DNA-binding GntR family transcriptional regulator